MWQFPIVLAVAVGGSLGALARHVMSPWVLNRFPLGTLAANLTGCLLIGLIVGSLHHRAWLTRELQAFLVIGFLGSLTTFSTFGYQTVALLLDGHRGMAALNLLANVALGFVLVWAGIEGGRLLTASR
jgi:CrcB protein